MGRNWCNNLFIPVWVHFHLWVWTAFTMLYCSSKETRDHFEVIFRFLWKKGFLNIFDFWGRKVILCHLLRVRHCPTGLHGWHHNVHTSINRKGGDGLLWLLKVGGPLPASSSLPLWRVSVRFYQGGQGASSSEIIQSVPSMCYDLWTRVSSDHHSTHDQ